MWVQELTCLVSHHKLRQIRQSFPFAGRPLFFLPRGALISVLTIWQILLHASHRAEAAQAVWSPSGDPCLSCCAWYLFETALAILARSLPPAAMLLLIFPGLEDFCKPWEQLLQMCQSPNAAGRWGSGVVLLSEYLFCLLWRKEMGLYSLVLH